MAQHPMTCGAREGVVTVVPGLAEAHESERSDVRALVGGVEWASTDRVADGVDAPRDVVQQADPDSSGSQERREAAGNAAEQPADSEGQGK